MKWTKAADYHDMSTLGMEIIYRAAADALTAGRRFNLGLATGNTMLELYPALAGMFNRNRIDLSSLHTYNLDEYVLDGKPVSHAHPLSYHTYMHENFFRHIDHALGFMEENIHFPDPVDPEKFDRELAAAGGLDLQLLGIGFNGHIAFNEPMSEAEISAAGFAELPTRIVELKALTIATNSRLTAGNDDSLVPRHAVSMGMKPIIAAGKLLLLACFAEQEELLNAIKKLAAPTPELPASYLLGHRDSEIIYTADKIVIK